MCTVTAMQFIVHHLHVPGIHANIVHVAAACVPALGHAYGLVCAGEEGALRLTDGGDSSRTSSGSGVLEIFHAGAWGTICEADVSLTYEYLEAQALSDVSLLSSLADGSCIWPLGSQGPAADHCSSALSRS